MYKFLAVIAALFAVLGALSVALMYYAHYNQGGMAVLAFQLWAVIGSLAALFLGFMSNLLAKQKRAAKSGLAKFAMALGGLSLLALIAAFVIIG